MIPMFRGVEMGTPNGEVACPSALLLKDGAWSPGAVTPRPFTGQEEAVFSADLLSVGNQKILLLRELTAIHLK